MKNIIRSLSIAVYLEELKTQCLGVFDSYNELNESVSTLDKVREDRDNMQAKVFHGLESEEEMARLLHEGKKLNSITPTEEEYNRYKNTIYESEEWVRHVHRRVQYIISHVGIISFFLYPSNRIKDKDKYKENRGSILRALTYTQKDSPIFDRSLRNSYQHYDERMDVMLKEADGFDFRSVGPIDSFLHENSRSFSYDPIKKTVAFPDRNKISKLEIVPLLKEVKRIETRVSNLLEKILNRPDDQQKEVQKYINDVVQEYYKNNK